MNDDDVTCLECIANSDVPNGQALRGRPWPEAGVRHAIHVSPTGGTWRKCEFHIMPDGVWRTDPGWNVIGYEIWPEGYLP